MNQQDVFNYLKENLSIKIEQNCSYYDRIGRIKVSICLINPENDWEEFVASDSIEVQVNDKYEDNDY